LVERFERLWWVEFFGILHFVQDDGRNLQVAGATARTKATQNKGNSKGSGKSNGIAAG
jgi:hypothetical protein